MESRQTVLQWLKQAGAKPYNEYLKRRLERANSRLRREANAYEIYRAQGEAGILVELVGLEKSLATTDKKE